MTDRPEKPNMEEVLKKAAMFNSLSPEVFVNKQVNITPVDVQAALNIHKLSAKKKDYINTLSKVNEEHVNELPSTLKMAWNFTNSVKDVAINAVTKGVVLTPPEEVKRRINICNSCPSLIVQDTRCAKCGCFLNSKVRFMSSKCPIGNW